MKDTNDKHYTDESDAEMFRWFIENILEYFPAGYSGYDVGKFEVWWPSDTSDIREAIRKEMGKEK